MKEGKKGYVYFFKHIGMSPIKIGYTSDDNPLSRFESFKTYAPYGGEFVGFIESENAKNLESRLHKKYAEKRLEGEWFEIPLETVQSEIDYHQSKTNIEQMNEVFEKYFEIKNLGNNRIKMRKLKEIFSNDANKNHDTMVIVQKKEISKILEMPLEDVRILMEKNKIPYKPNRINKVQLVKGYKMYTSQDNIKKYELTYFVRR